MPKNRLSGPVSEAEEEALFAGLLRFHVAGLAVSGGPDSLALMHLFARWRSRQAAPVQAIVMTVDHGLRAQAADEARFVAREAEKLGLAHETLAWGGDKPRTGIANAAREARYRLLSQRLALESGRPRALVTAHTQDDQAETVLMRLARGSGAEGLAGMARQRALPGEAEMTLVRPLLDVPKVRLEATLTALGLGWITDPTNFDPAFERPRLRRTMRSRDEAGLTHAALALSASRLARANSALDEAVAALAAAAVRHTDGLAGIIDRSTFDAAPEELRIRLLARLLRAYGGSHPEARLSEIERLAARLARDSAGRTTLAGCLVTPDAATIAIHRETGRGLPVIELAPATTAIWDERFRVELADIAPGACTVRALSITDCREAGLKATRDILSAPSFWHEGRMVAIPQAGRLRDMPGLERQLHSPARAAEIERFEPACRAAALTIKPVQ